MWEVTKRRMKRRMEEGGGRRRRNGGVWLVNGFWQTRGGIFAVLEGGQTVDNPPETRTDAHIRAPSLKGSLKRKKVIGHSK